MVGIEQYRKVISDFLGDYANLSDSYHLVFDTERDRYLIMNDEWHDQRRIYGCVMHIDIINNKIWIQQNNTEVYIEDELAKKGVEPKDIILGLRSPGVRELIAAALEEA